MIKERLDKFSCKVEDLDKKSGYVCPQCGIELTNSQFNCIGKIIKYNGYSTFHIKCGNGHILERIF